MKCHDHAGLKMDFIAEPLIILEAFIFCPMQKIAEELAIPLPCVVRGRGGKVYNHNLLGMCVAITRGKARQNTRATPGEEAVY